MTSQLLRVAHADITAGNDPAVILEGLLAADLSWRQAAPQEAHGAVPNQPVEVSDVSPGTVAEYLPALMTILGEINRTVFHLDITGLVQEDPVLLARDLPVEEYSTQELFERAQPDICDEWPMRKLTFAVRFGEDSCGRIRLVGGSDTMSKDPGYVSVFASFRPWVIEPSRSLSYTLIGRLHGPIWR